MLICGRNINPFSTVTYSFTNASEIARTILLILVRVYEGYKIKKDILHPFIPHTSFLKLYKIGKQDAKILQKHVLVLKGLTSFLILPKLPLEKPYNNIQSFLNQNVPGAKVFNPFSTRTCFRSIFASYLPILYSFRKLV